MADAKHTPGEWKVLKGAAEGDDMRCAVVVEQGKMQYLLATIENGAPGDFCETEEANARLIAAAPDLLEVVTLLLAVKDADYDAIPSNVIDATERDAWVKARTAIAKATGAA